MLGQIDVDYSTFFRPESHLLDVEAIVDSMIIPHRILIGDVFSHLSRLKRFLELHGYAEYFQGCLCLKVHKNTSISRNLIIKLNVSAEKSVI